MRLAALASFLSVALTLLLSLCTLFRQPNCQQRLYFPMKISRDGIGKESPDASLASASMTRAAWKETWDSWAGREIARRGSYVAHDDYWCGRMTMWWEKSTIRRKP